MEPDELAPNEVMIEATVGTGEDGMGVVLRRIIPLTLKELIALYGEDECVFMLRETVRSRIQKKAYRLVKDVVDGKAEDNMSDDCKIAEFMYRWNPPGELPKTKEEKLIEDIENIAQNLSDDEVKRLLSIAKTRGEQNRAKKAAAATAKEA